MQRTRSEFPGKIISLFLLLLGIGLIYNPLTKFPYTFCVITLYVLAVTYIQDKNLSALNFRRLKPKDLITIICCYLLLEISTDFIIQPFISWIFNEPADYSAFSKLEGNLAMYFKWLWRMWISAAIGEELLFRAFAFSQLKRVVGKNKILIILLSSVLFSLPHLYQGPSGLAITFIFGLAFAYIYWKFQNIWINIIIHGLIDTVFLTLSYFGLLDFYNGIW